jgi:hypothetical protein
MPIVLVKFSFVDQFQYVVFAVGAHPPPNPMVWVSHPKNGIVGDILPDFS